MVKLTRYAVTKVTVTKCDECEKVWNPASSKTIEEFNYYDVQTCQMCGGHFCRDHHRHRNDPKDINEITTLCEECDKKVFGKEVKNDRRNES